MEYWQSSPYKICSAWVIFVSLDILIGAARGSMEEQRQRDEVTEHLRLGGELLARGHLQDALSHFHAAVEGDPKNYLTYFKRGTVYLALGKAKFAIIDFNTVLDLKPDFTGARYQRGHIYLKQGQLQQAMEDFLYVNQVDYNEEAYNNYVRAQNLESDVALAKALMKDGDHGSGVDLLSSIIEVCPWSSHLRELRSESYMALGDPMSAILDLKSTTKLQADNTDGYYKLAILYYQLGQAYESLREVRDCLKLDPDHKDCFPHYKKVKKIDKLLNEAQDALNSGDYDTCVKAAMKVVNGEDKVAKIRWHGHGKLCKCHLKNNEPTESVKACDKALEISRDPELHCDLAEAYLAQDMFDEAIRHYQEGLELDRDFGRASEGIERARKLQKQSEKRDYYKILQVPRTATKKQIIKAYREAARTWHPDIFPEGPEKKKAEKKFIDIAAAKEVLTDKEKREKFDQGQDPLDPESGSHQHGFNPFQQFHSFHHGTPFTFKFNFN